MYIIFKSIDTAQWDEYISSMLKVWVQSPVLHGIPNTMSMSQDLKK